MNSDPIKFISSTSGHCMLRVYTKWMSIVSLIFFLYFMICVLKFYLLEKWSFCGLSSSCLLLPILFHSVVSNATCGLHLSFLPVSETFILLYLCNSLGLFPFFFQLWLVSCFPPGLKPCSHHLSPSNFSSYKNP